MRAVIHQFDASRDELFDVLATKPAPIFQIDRKTASACRVRLHHYIQRRCGAVYLLRETSTHCVFILPGRAMGSELFGTVDGCPPVLLLNDRRLGDAAPPCRSGSATHITFRCSFRRSEHCTRGEAHLDQLACSLSAGGEVRVAHREGGSFWKSSPGGPSQHRIVWGNHPTEVSKRRDIQGM